MPGKLVVLVVLMGLNLLLTGVEVALAPGFNVVALLINAFLLYSVIRGNESIRRAMIALSYLGLILSVVALILALLVLSRLLGTLLGIIALAAIFVSIARCVYTIWVLNQPDVQSWMFKRSLGLSGSDPI